MRIFHVTTFLQGGAGRIIAALAIAQRRAGHDVTVVADDGGETGYASYPDYVASLAAAGIGYHRVRSIFRRDLDLNVQAARQVRVLAGGRRVDVTHTHAAIATLVARLALGPGTRGRLVQTMHGWGIRKTPDQAATDITLLGAADAVVTPSAAAGDTLRTLGLTGVPLHVVPYGLDSEWPAAGPDDADAAMLARLRAAGSALALCIGTIGERKNQALLVEALATRPDMAAVFIGDGDPAPLVAAARARGVAARVHVLGYRADASRYLPLADVLVLPSQNEGLPIVVLEALRAGVPVVASAIPEIAEAVDDGATGWLFAPGDAAALARALGRALDPAHRDTMPQRARTTFAARFGLDRMTAAYQRIYQLDEPGGRGV